MIEVSHNVVKIRNQETDAFEAVPGLVLGYTGEAIEPAIRELSYLKDSDEIKRLIFDMTYPIGSIIHNTKEGNPKTYLGYGEWSQIKDRFLLAVGDSHFNKEEGGYETISLTTEQMPKHRHLPGNVGTAGSESDYPRCFMTALSVNSDSVYRTEVDTAASDIYTIVAKVDEDITTTAATSYEGEGIPHNNMPPYKTVYIWERTA